MHSILSQQSPQGCCQNSVNVCLVEDKLFLTFEGAMSVASFLNSSFLQAVSVVMLWPAHVQKFPQASKHLCSAKLQTRCDVCCVCQSICWFIPTDSSMPRAVDRQMSLQPKTVHGSVPAGVAYTRLYFLQQVPAPCNIHWWVTQAGSCQDQIVHPFLTQAFKSIGNRPISADDWKMNIRTDATSSACFLKTWQVTVSVPPALPGLRFRKKIFTAGNW